MSKLAQGKPSSLSPNDKRRFTMPSRARSQALAKRAIQNLNNPDVVKVHRKGPKLLTCIQAELDKRAPNEYLTRREKAAMAFVDEMEAGSFAHHKEILDREEGKVPSRLTVDDGTPLKAFINMPTDGEDAP